MIAQKGREGKRAKALKLAKLYKEGKCRECSVVVTRMDFAKILGKFTKVKIQYESSSPKTQISKQPTTTLKSNGRLKNNENGLVQGYKSKRNATPTKQVQVHKPKIIKSKEVIVTKRQTNNILKENNGVKKDSTPKNKVVNLNNKVKISNHKQYAIIFNNPKNNNINDMRSELSLVDLLPKVNTSILPSPEWCIDFFPKPEEPKDDKVYDRIAAELEDLMRSEQPQIQNSSEGTTDNKVDEFPSIMDILNDNTNITTTEQKDQSTSLEFKENLDSSDVEAMLLGKPDNQPDPTPMEVESSDVNNLIENAIKINTDSTAKEEIQKSEEKIPEISEPNEEDNPSSPSILDDALKPIAEEQLPNDKVNTDEKSLQPEASLPEEKNSLIKKENESDISKIHNKKDCVIDSQNIPQENSFQLPLTKLENILYLTFKKVVDGKCLKSVKCPKNLKCVIELDEKSVEFLGAPKYISTLDDLQVLLQIVNESELSSPYVLY